ncbi:MAG: class I SAM-dependent methyltransferase [Verrucomicrobiota bacterium]|nr:class I SAM-dependent methyltransferase [Verrucomicrobiota bacterium]
MARGQPSELVVTRISNQEDFQKHIARINAADPNRRKQERELAQQASYFRTLGFCFVCGQWTEFFSSWDYAYEVDGHLHVNWREHLLCPLCHLNNRMRATIHLLAQTVAPTKQSHIYATEQSSPLFRHLQKRFPFAVGSEYLGDAVPLGQNNSAGIRNEDLTRLSFPGEIFDAILSFEVLEHIPDYRRAFAECVRTLKPGGKMLFCVPFDTSASCNRIRARVRAEGTIEHLLPPEYHYDPINSEGCLCFQHFGWEMMQQMKETGFSTVSALCYYSRDYGYLGGEQIQFFAEK